MNINELKEYAQGLFDKGIPVEDIKTIVATKLVDCVDEDGNKVEAKDFKLELEEKSVDIEVEVKKEVDKIKAKKEDKNYVPFKNEIQHVSRPTQAFADVSLAEKFAANILTKDFMSKIGMQQKTITTYSNITTANDGGSLNPTYVNGVLADLVKTYQTFQEKTLQVPMGSSSAATFVSNRSALTGYFVGENTAGTDQKMSVPTSTLTAKKIIVPAPVSNDLLRFGSLADAGDVIAIAIARAIVSKQEWALWGADGTADTTDGGFKSVQYSIKEVSENAGLVEVASWSAMDIDDAIDCLGKLDGSFVDWNNVAWYCSRAMWATLEKLARADEQQYIVISNQKPNFQLLGYPVHIVNSMPATQSTDNIDLVFGDLRTTVATGMPVLLDGQVSIHPDTYATVDVSLFQGISYWAQNVYNPGTSSVVGGCVGVNFGGSS